MFKGQFLKGKVDPFGTRDAVKVQTMIMLYDDYSQWTLKFRKATLAFIDRFPEIGNLLLLLKSSGYKNCPCLLQRLESHLILKDVAKALYSSNVAPVFTIHDSIVVLPNIADKAEKIMSDIIFKKTGLRPKIKREDWI
jgi:hypothetical protein